MWQNLRLETFASLLESIVIFKIAFDSFFFPLYGYRFGFMFFLLLLKFFPRLVDSQFLVNTKLQVITSFAILEKLCDG